MSDSQLPRIAGVAPLPRYRLTVEWNRFPRMTVDLSELIQRGGVFQALRDEPEFAKVRIGDRHRTIEWPAPQDDLGYPVIHIDAESLHSMAVQQRHNNLVTGLMKFLREYAWSDPSA